VWHPFSGGSWGGLFQHAINLLEGQALGFWDEEIGVHEADSAKTSPEEEDLWAEIDTAAGCGGDVWCDDGDDAVPEPVGGGGKSYTTGSDWKWEDLTDDNPGTWSPCGGKEEDVDADQSDHGGDG